MGLFRSKEINMTEGPVLGKMILFTIPVMASGILQLLFNAADVAVVGRFVGEAAVAAVGGCGALINLIINLFIGLSVGAGVIAAQDLGARRHDEVTKLISTSLTASLVGGIAVMLFGIVFESAADIQKNAAKKINPKRFVDTGLYRIVRCPNYLGEMIFWTGVLLSGIGSLTGAGQWIMALIGYIGIIFVMFSGARRLEIRQNKNYGKDPAYQKYVKTVPILVPFIPLYSVEKYKFLVA
jgi:protein-S-isoprenylcysteine O-methyltransferase Ste14